METTYPEKKRKEMEPTASKMVKPVYSAPHPLAGEMIPLTLFDRAAMDIFVSLILVYPAPTPSNEALVEEEMEPHAGAVTVTRPARDADRRERGRRPGRRGRRQRRPGQWRSGSSSKKQSNKQRLLLSCRSL